MPVAFKFKTFCPENKNNFARKDQFNFISINSQIKLPNSPNFKSTSVSPTAIIPLPSMFKSTSFDSTSHLVGSDIAFLNPTGSVFFCFLLRTSFNFASSYIIT